MTQEVPRRDPHAPLSPAAAHNEAMRLSMAEVVRQLVDILGATTVALIGGVGETRAVQQWMTGREPQRGHALRFALQLARMLVARADRDVARAWFHGSNPHLDDRVPAFMLRGEPLEEIQRPLLEAAREFEAGRKPQAE